MSRAWQSAVIGIAIAVHALVVRPAAAQGDPPPPSASTVCPAIEGDGLLCASDSLGLSGNCTSFIAAADRLGALYRAELEKMPDSKDALLTTSWWGCGPASLFDVKRLLTRLGSAPALAVLGTEPYRSLPAVPRRPAPTETLSCVDLQSPVDRNLCIGEKLEAVRELHQAAFARCKALVADALRDDLLESEASFERQLRPLCDTDTAEAGENAWFRCFDRSQCLVQSYRERTSAMLALHPECAAED